MAKKTLVDSDIKAGEKLTKYLDGKGFNFSAAMWFYLSGDETWRFVFGIPKVNTFGIKKFLFDIQFFLKDFTFEDLPVISLEEVTIIDSTDNLLNIMKMMIRTGPKDISGIRASQNYVNGVHIEDAYIYRMS